MAHDATFVAGIRQVRDDVLGLICDGNMLRSEISDQRWHQFDFKGHSCLECGQQPSGLLRIVEHQRTPSTIEPSDSAITNDREYPPFRVNRPIGVARLIANHPQRSIDRRIKGYDDELAERVRNDDAAKRLIRIPGIGVLTASFQHCDCYPVQQAPGRVFLSPETSIQAMWLTAGGSFLRSKSNAGGNRARARQSCSVEICLDSLTSLTLSP
jgi:hypothetical protein